MKHKIRIIFLLILAASYIFFAVNIRCILLFFPMKLSLIISKKKREGTTGFIEMEDFPPKKIMEIDLESYPSIRDDESG